ncbi:MAG TPA: CaiB/BaiF CoA-transferase family protein [Patescibacteria group bacterium]|nr:CaiB/BaiF CoA-transferase family protein [Patescibacteria group bacterium]
MTDIVENTGPLKGIRVFDMSRILAGPSATQILGDMGAEVLKIEKPGQGDDTRKWGPPFVKDASGADTTESSYYLSANRNKKSLSLDFTTPEGLAIAKKLIGTCDILFENYKAGSLDKYGLGYAQLKADFPRLIYCSLTGFGHNGPYKDLAGYDFLIQGMGGIMSLTGPADGMPHKIGVAYCDLLTGLYALNGILAALYHREKTGKGQFIDIALLDSQVATLSNAGQYYLTSGKVTPRMGNAHPTIVPYEAFRAKDGDIILAIGNDKQFAAFCDFAARPELAADPKFAENKNRVRNRAEIVPLVAEIIAQQPQRYWIENLEQRGVPCGPVNTLDKVFNDPQVQARGMVTEMPHAATPAPVKLIASPLRFSETPVSYRHAPPMLGANTDEILTSELDMSPAEIQKLRSKGVL